MNVVNIERSRSGDADPSCSCRNRDGSILDGAVIAWFSFSTVVGLQEDHAVAALLVYATPLTCRGLPHTTLLDSTSWSRRTLDVLLDKDRTLGLAA